MALRNGWKVDKSNSDTERFHLNKILKEILAYIDALVLGGQVDSVQPGTGVTVDSSDPVNPEVALSAGSVASLALADTAVQPGDNISVLVNDSGYVTAAEAESAASVLSLPAGAVITAGQIVRADSGSVYPVDTSVQAHGLQVLGMALQSVTTIGNPVQVRIAGEVTEAAWSWSPGVVYCGPTGLPTQSPSSTGWLIQVGRVVSATSITIDIEPLLLR